MALDPFTLIIALNEAGEAKGTVYLDDEESYDYKAKRQGVGRTTRRFDFRGGVLTGKAVEGSGTFPATNM